MRNLRLAILAVAVFCLPGCAALCDILDCSPDPTPTPTPTPTPVPTPPPAEQCHLMEPPAVCGCYHAPPPGDWVYACCTPDGVVNAPTPEECPVEPPPELPQPQCSTFVNRGSVVKLQGGECDCYAGLEWIPCEPPPPSECTFPQGVPEDHFTHHPEYPNTLGSTVNGVMSNMSGCSVGSDCPLAMGPDEWMDAVNQRLRDMGYCAGRHNETPPGATDQISVTNSGSFCNGPSQNFQIYNFGGGKVRWSPGAYQGAWSILPQDCAPRPPPGTVCEDPNPRGLPAMFALERVGNGNKVTSTYKISQRSYCDQVCSPVEPDVCFTGRNNCPVRFEGDPERVPCERDPDVVGDQKWWCDGQPNDGSTENPAQSICSGAARTCTEDGDTCAEIPPK